MARSKEEVAEDFRKQNFDDLEERANRPATCNSDVDLQNTQPSLDMELVMKKSQQEIRVPRMMEGAEDEATAASAMRGDAAMEFRKQNESHLEERVDRVYINSDCDQHKVPKLDEQLAKKNSVLKITLSVTNPRKRKAPSRSQSPRNSGCFGCREYKRFCRSVRKRSNRKYQTVYFVPKSDLAKTDFEGEMSISVHVFHPPPPEEKKELEPDSSCSSLNSFESSYGPVA